MLIYIKITGQQVIINVCNGSACAITEYMKRLIKAIDIEFRDHVAVIMSNHEVMDDNFERNVKMEAKHHLKLAKFFRQMKQ